MSHQSIFPSVNLADENGLLAVGGSFDSALLLEAYCNGIFPWPIPGFGDIPWFAPPKRAILRLEDLKISKRSYRQIRNSNFKYFCNTAFREVMEKCSEPINRKYRNLEDSKDASWITKDMIEGYVKLNELGFSHSIEVFNDSELVGGVYGVSIGSYFAAESMFYRKTDASKAALLCLSSILKSQNATFIDCQELNPYLEKIGTTLVLRDEFMEMLKTEISKNKINFPVGEIDFFHVL